MWNSWVHFNSFWFLIGYIIKFWFRDVGHMTKEKLHDTQYIMLGLSSWFWWSQRNVEFVGQNRCGPQHRKIINDGNRFVERRLSSSRSVCKISGETAIILSECMRVVLVKKTVTYFNFFVGYFKQCDMSVMTKVPNFII